MEFIQKHWARLSVALLFLIGGIIAIVSYADYFGDLDGVADWFPFIAAILFFFGSSAVAVLKIFAPKIVGILYGIMGGIVTILFTVILATEDLSGKGLDIFWWYIVPLIVFGVQPLVRGLIKFVEGEKVFTPAEVKTAPAPETAPKAAAKKTAK
jgi:peptidoglycan/LPS O-acetylase OafA/YrhL